MRRQENKKNEIPVWRLLLSHNHSHVSGGVSKKMFYVYFLEYQHWTTTYLLLATGRAISNLARNWKYCSSVCSVKPVPTNSSCTKDITTGSQHHHQHTRRPSEAKVTRSELTLRSSALITPFLAREREDLRCMILSRHSDSHTGHKK